MFLIGYSKYCFDKRILGYRPNGELSHASRAMRPDTPPEIVEKMKELNEEWKECHEGRPLYLFPGDENYPAELLKETGGK